MQNPLETRKVSLYAGVYGAKIADVSVSNVIHRIQNGTHPLKGNTLRARRLVETDKNAYQRLKLTLPAVTWSGTFNPRKKEGLTSYAELCVLDIDNLTRETTRDAMNSTQKLDSVLCSFISPSGHGVKVVIVLDEKTNPDTHRYAWESAKRYLEERIPFELNIDESGKDINRLCFLAHHQNAYVNWDATPLKQNVKPSTHRQPPQDAQKPPHVKSVEEKLRKKIEDELDLSFLECIPPDDNYGNWLKVGIALKNEGIPLHVWETWSRRGSKHKAGECQKKWDGFRVDGNCRLGTAIHIAKGYGYEPPKPKKKSAKKKVHENLLGDGPLWMGEKGRFYASGMAHTLMNRDKFIYLPGETGIRIYKNGVYKLDDVETVDEMVDREADGAHFNILPTHINNVVALMKLRCAIKPAKVMHPHIINCKNGIIDLSQDELELKPHPDDFLSITQIPVNYNPDAKMPVFREWLMAATQQDEELFNHLIEIIGLSLVQKAYLGKIFILVGPTKSGKSTFMYVLKAIVGDENISTVAMQDLDDNNVRFARSLLFGKLVNISSDMSKRALQGEKLKAISVGDPIYAEHKGEKPFSFCPYATLWGAANEMPSSWDKSEAFYDRLHLIPFKFQHSEGGDPDPDFTEKLTTEKEKEGIFALAISYAHQLFRAKKFQFKPEVIEQEREEYILDNHSTLDRFIDRYLTGGTGDDSVRADDLYEAYEEFCQEEDEEKKTKNVFGKTLRTTFPKMGSKQRQIDGVRTRYYTGVKYIG